MTAFATASRAATTAPLTRTPLAKPILGFEKRRLSIIGNTTPPHDAPETAIPVARARRLRKWCATMLRDGRKSMPTPRPTPTPCARNTWSAEMKSTGGGVKLRGHRWDVVILTH